MYKRNENKGITLIALVITIIVLLILAGVSIGMLAGDNSILKNATKSVKDKAIGDVREAALLAITDAFTDYHSKEATNTLGSNTLYTLTNAALDKVKQDYANNNEMKVDYSGGHFTAEYKKELGTVVLDGTLDATNGIFTWTKLYPSN